MTYIFVAAIVFLATMFFLPQPLTWRDTLAAIGLAAFFAVGLLLI